MNDVTIKQAAAANDGVAAPGLRGLHHLALNTDDMAMTIDFYVDVLGMPLIHGLKVPPEISTGEGNRGNPPFDNLRHYFFDMGGDSLLAFFEIPKGEKPKGDRDAIAAMQHVAFSATPERFKAIRAELDKRKIDYLGPIEILPEMFSIYFYDPNGIRLEVCVHPNQGDAPRIVHGTMQDKSGARAELETLSDDKDWIEKRLDKIPG